jgi:hypothetical protein
VKRDTNVGTLPHQKFIKSEFIKSELGIERIRYKVKPRSSETLSEFISLDAIACVFRDPLGLVCP